ncbi:hypothetical protein EMIHUDRAFT_443010, partial [Emiliania huxleyi CCMP1516]|uniref:Uncharacterized protein n=2 Tax=Emiliania huxleyi TaxID=2903 RepID=A0A0D3JXB5_EMIH1
PIPPFRSAPQVSEKLFSRVTKYHAQIGATVKKARAAPSSPLPARERLRRFRAPLPRRTLSTSWSGTCSPKQRSRHGRPASSAAAPRARPDPPPALAAPRPRPSPQPPASHPASLPCSASSSTVASTRWRSTPSPPASRCVPARPGAGGAQPAAQLRLSPLPPRTSSPPPAAPEPLPPRRSPLSLGSRSPRALQVTEKTRNSKDFAVRGAIVHNIASCLHHLGEIEARSLLESQPARVAAG